MSSGGLLTKRHLKSSTSFCRNQRRRSSVRQYASRRMKCEKRSFRAPSGVFGMQSSRPFLIPFSRSAPLRPFARAMSIAFSSLSRSYAYSSNSVMESFSVGGTE